MREVGDGADLVLTNGSTGSSRYEDAWANRTMVRDSRITEGKAWGFGIVGAVLLPTLINGCPSVSGSKDGDPWPGCSTWICSELKRRAHHFKINRIRARSHRKICEINGPNGQLTFEDSWICHSSVRPRNPNGNPRYFARMTIGQLMGVFGPEDQKLLDFLKGVALPRDQRVEDV